MNAVILCGGKGSRLAEETRLTPKPMVNVGGIPILIHIIKHMRSYGIKKIFLATGYKSEIIEKYFKKEIYLKDIFPVYTGKNSLTGGRLLRLRNHLIHEEEFLVTYGDGLTDLDLNKLINFHHKHKKIATVTAVNPPVRFGELELKGNLVKNFSEKRQIKNSWISGGFFIFKKDIFKYLKNSQTVLETNPMIKLTITKNLRAFQHKGFWQCMDTLREKKLLDELWRQNKAPWKVK